MKRFGTFWRWLYLIGVLATGARAEGLPSPAQVAAFLPVPPPAIAVPVSVVRALRGRCYHRPGCTAARGRLAVISPAQAIADGLKACQRCLDKGARRRRRAADAGGLDALPEVGARPPAPVESAPSPSLAPAAPATVPAPVESAHSPPLAPAAPVTVPAPVESASPRAPAPVESPPPASRGAVPSPAGEARRRGRAAHLADPVHGEEPIVGAQSRMPWDDPGALIGK